MIILFLIFVLFNIIGKSLPVTMMEMKIRWYLLFLTTLFLMNRPHTIGTQDYGRWPTEIPKTWDGEALQSMELPMPDPAQRGGKSFSRLQAVLFVTRVLLYKQRAHTG